MRIGFGMRLVAAIIDGIAMAVIYFILYLPFKPSLDVSKISDPQYVADYVTKAATRAALISGLVWLAYSAMEIFLAQTPGKMALKMKITNQDGLPATQDQLIRRWAIKNSASILRFLYGIIGLSIVGLLANLAGLFVLVSCLMALRMSKLALHDEWAGTQVTGPATDAVGVGFPVQPTGAAVPPPPPPQPVGVGSIPPPPPTAPVG